MTPLGDFIYRFFSPDTNPIVNAIAQGWDSVLNDMTYGGNAHIHALLTYSTFGLLLFALIWLFIKLLLWLFRLLGIGG